LNGIRSKEEKGGYHTDGPSTSKGSSNGGRNDRGYASAADGSSRRHRDGEGFGSDDDEEEEEEEYGDSAWAYDEAKDVFESGEWFRRSRFMLAQQQIVMQRKEK
jgi:hypothetical protein